ncbi:MAG: DUF4330 domain-containing protein [Chloroflexaceae bacterium]|nr:DUF4330 domain-containing protein [Chloroflexaceae bacterium]
MKILDSKGRLGGKLSILDLGAACVILLVLAGIFLFPGTTGSIAQNVVGTDKQSIEVEILVRGLSVRDPEALLQELQENNTVSIIIRNQPAGNIKIGSVTQLPQTVTVPQPDGTVKALPDPRPEAVYSTDMLMIANGDGQITENGAVLGGQKVKIGSVIELDGADYNFRGSVIDVRSGKQ